jgi:hypothetical protein
LVEYTGALKDLYTRSASPVKAQEQRGLLAVIEKLGRALNVYTWDALSWVLFKNGSIPEAREASKKALKFRTPEPQFYYHARAAAGDSAEAESAAALLQTLNPKFDVGK